jgi:5-methyltetrahydrofolate--homocysteine methyltransferase
MVYFDELSQAVIAGDCDTSIELTKKAMVAGVPAREILRKGLLPSMEIVGAQFEKSEIFFPELLMAANTMKATVALLKPELSKSKVPSAGKFVIGTVSGDAHDIGKNIVMMMLEQNGWEVIDLGTDVPKEEFCSIIKEGKVDILGLSALLTFTIPEMADVISALEAAGLRDKVKVMIGGAPVTQFVADEIGADAYAKDAVEAVRKAKSLISRV